MNGAWRRFLLNDYGANIAEQTRRPKQAVGIPLRCALGGSDGKPIEQRFMCLRRTSWSWLAVREPLIRELAWRPLDATTRERSR
jgi:hypothetical protein